ncbi:hypothetical protein B566_EDAN011810 [Ephemera danica]|nr:hypothetical protein B566_EDAN011810 [Ephemera danica]
MLRYCHSKEPICICQSMQGSGPPGGHHSPLSSPLFAGHAAAAAAAAAAHLSGQLHPSPGGSHHQMHQHPVDLHVPTAAFPYYRYRDDAAALCWAERGPMGTYLHCSVIVGDAAAAASVAVAARGVSSPRSRGGESKEISS